MINKARMAIAVVRAVLTSKAFWKLAAMTAVMAGVTLPDGFLSALADVLQDVLGSVVSDAAASVLTAPFAGMT